MTTRRSARPAKKRDKCQAVDNGTPCAKRAAGGYRLRGGYPARLCRGHATRWNAQPVAPVDREV